MGRRSRLRCCVPVVAAIVLGAALLAVAGASAQSVWTGHGPTGRTIRLPPVLPRYEPAWPSYGYRPGNAWPDDGQTFRTVCVRTCDGYYWPISFSTTPGRFFSDEAQCRLSCNGGSRLYYHPNPGGGMSNAIDLEGRAYTQLSSAFLYRRKRIEGCACRPAPWSHAERERHRQFKRNAAQADGAGADLATDVAGAGDTDSQPPPVSIGRVGIVLPPIRIERHRR